MWNHNQLYLHTTLEEITKTFAPYILNSPDAREILMIACQSFKSFSVFWFKLIMRNIGTRVIWRWRETEKVDSSIDSTYKLVRPYRLLFQFLQPSTFLQVIDYLYLDISYYYKTLRFWIPHQIIEGDWTAMINARGLLLTGRTDQKRDHLYTRFP